MLPLLLPALALQAERPSLLLPDRRRIEAPSLLLPGDKAFDETLSILPFPSAMMLNRAGAAGSWQTMRDTSALTPTANDGWLDYTRRARFFPGGLIDIAGATKSRLTFYAMPTGTEGFRIDKVYFGLSASQVAAPANPYDFDGSQVQALFGGLAGTTIAVGGSATTDDIAFAPDGTKYLMLAVHVFNSSSTDTMPNVTQSDVTNGYKLGDDAASTSVSGYTGYGIDFRYKLEVFA